ncbi:ferritin-like fold-containing protein [Isoptericola chiayiensis]|uniref:Ferritin-like fold-containing protein n=1 Tax=Isoptericola chiayiensis TaxID=579446 RepID=A0ABP8YTE2_9MICO
MPPVDPSTPAPVSALVGIAAYTELAGFGLLAARSVDAPDLATRQSLALGAERALSRQQALVGLVAPGAGVPAAAALMGPFEGALVEFDTRTRTDDWAEGVLKGVVGHGVAQDFCRTLAAGVGGQHGKRLREVLEVAGAGPAARDGADAEALSVLVRLASADDVLASRLALWGRRVVGEALNLVTALLEQHAELESLTAASAAALGHDAADGSVRSWLVARLTAEHTRRMDRLGLAA